jgi:hypothetical protein
LPFGAPVCVGVVGILIKNVADMWSLMTNSHDTPIIVNNRQHTDETELSKRSKAGYKTPRHSMRGGGWAIGSVVVILIA